MPFNGRPRPRQGFVSSPRDGAPNGGPRPRQGFVSSPWDGAPNGRPRPRQGFVSSPWDGAFNGGPRPRQGFVSSPRDGAPNGGPRPRQGFVSSHSNGAQSRVSDDFRQLQMEIEDCKKENAVQTDCSNELKWEIVEEEEMEEEMERMMLINKNLDREREIEVANEKMTLEEQKNQTEMTEMFKVKMEKKDFFLAQEKYFKESAEKDSLVYVKKIKDAETRLEAERQLTLDCKGELNQCKGIIEDLVQSSKTLEKDGEVKSKQEEAHKLVLDEIEKLKKQLEEETNSHLDLISKLEAQETLKSNVQFKIAELTEQLKFALETSESSATENLSEMISVSSQTDNTSFKNVSEPSEPERVSEQEAEKSSPTEPEHSKDKMLEVVVENSNNELNQDVAANVGVSGPEEVSELKMTTESQLVSEASEQKAKKRRRRKKKKPEQSDDANQPEDGLPTADLVIDVELTEESNQPEVGDNLAAKVGDPEPEELSKPVPTPETALVSKQDGVAGQKAKTRRRRKKKSGKSEDVNQVIEYLPQSEDGVPTADLMIDVELTEESNQPEVSDNLAAKVGDPEPEELSKPVPTPETTSVSEQDGVGGQKAKKRKRRKKKSEKSEDVNQVIEYLPQSEDGVPTADLMIDVELTEESNQPEVSDNLAAKVGDPEPEELSKPVPTPETTSVSEQDGVGGQKAKKRKRRKKKSEKSEDVNQVIEYLPQSEDGIPTPDLMIMQELAIKVGVAEPEGVSELVGANEKVTETALVSEHDGVSEQEAKKQRPRRNNGSVITENLKQFEVIEGLPEPKDAVIKEDTKMVYNPSLWRQFKKFLTPACLRQYKHKNTVQD
ncbi:nuclear anchorage protein 1-like [Cololabis saira]|uniref:nuclear anchorage protein 1-like n=1 Tax=Cololabis saira TaxID=129043 RepID=UPI002AD4450A|nr:nuclear anchorage protein 1-like [Cololabis saira]